MQAELQTILKVSECDVPSSHGVVCTHITSCHHRGYQLRTHSSGSNYTYSRAVFSAVSATYQERITKEMFALLEMTGWIKCRQQ